MIDASASPVPQWKRYTMMVALFVVVFAAGYFIYTKELHHGGGSSAANPNTVQPAPIVAPPVTVKPAQPTGPIGGLPISSRNPFT